MTIRPATVLALLLALLALGSVLLLRSGCRKDEPQTTGPPTVLPDTVIVKERPKPPTTFGQKIVRHRVPSTISTSAGTPDTGRSGWYADAAHEADSLRHLADSLRHEVTRGDSTAGAQLARLSRPKRLLPPVAGRYDDKKLTLWLTRSDGSLMVASARLKPRFNFYAGQNAQTDTLPLFDEDRAWIRTLRQVRKCAPPAGVVAGLGALVNLRDRPLGAIIGGGATLIGCLIG